MFKRNSVSILCAGTVGAFLHDHAGAKKTDAGHDVGHDLCRAGGTIEMMPI